MTVSEARIFIVRFSLMGTTLAFLFFVIGKPLGYPLAWSQVQRIVEIVVPVFLGYLGAASLFVFSRNSPDKNASFGENEELAKTILYGAAGAFVLIFIGILFAFGWTNRANGDQDEGMSIDQLSWWITAVLGILNVSTNAAVSYLFLGGQAKSPESTDKSGNTSGTDASTTG